MNLKLLTACCFGVAYFFALPTGAGEEQPHPVLPSALDLDKKTNEKFTTRARSILSLLGAQEGPKVKVTFLGVTTRSPDAAMRKQLRLAAGTGLSVESVCEKSPAKEAGLEVHDVITKFNDQVLINQEQFVTLIRMYKPGDKVELTVIKEGKEQKVTATLAEGESAPLGMDRTIKWLDDVVTKRWGDALKAGDTRAPVAEFKDPEVEMEITLRDGTTFLVAKDKGGKILYEGPLTDHVGGLPSVLRTKICGMVQMLGEEASKSFKMPLKYADDPAEAK